MHGLKRKSTFFVAARSPICAGVASVGVFVENSLHRRLESLRASFRKISPEHVPFRILLPVVLTAVLFVGTIFLLILPSIEARMLADKRQMVSELTEAAWSVLDAYHRKQRAGALSRSEAQSLAIDSLRHMRYGPEGKDYFWINDTRPFLVMHPYRPDLEGTDISQYADPSGKKLFVEFVRTVQNDGSGYVDYQWQWKDDPDRIVPKISYVKGFEPWGWIVGTGIYVEDVRAEIAALTRKLTWVCAAISVLIIGLSSYIIRQGARSEHRRRQSEEALQRSEQKYRLLTETAREFILAFQTDGRLVYANRAWLRAGGYDGHTILAMNMADLLPEEERAAFRERVAQLSAGLAEGELFETEFVTRDGTRIPVEAMLAKLAAVGEVQRVFIAARDMTEKKRAEKQAELHREQLFQADKMATLGTLVSGVAHEINNPVTFVMMNAPLLQKTWESVLPILDEYRRVHGDFKVGRMDYSRLRDRLPALVGDITAGAARVKAIVADLKDFARQGPPEMTDEVDLNAVSEKAISLVANLINKSTRNFKAEYGAELPRFAGNAQKIEQVIINLLVNACQALRDPGGAIGLNTGYEPDTGSLWVEVRDQGSGIPADKLQRIRDPFFTTKRDSGGTGLGLAIADRIVEDHGGRMTFDSVVGEGTTVRVRFPAARTSSQDAA